MSDIRMGLIRAVTEIEALEAANAKLTAERDTLRAELAAVTEEIIKLTAELSGAKECVKSLNKHITRAQGNTRTMKDERDAVRAELAAERERNSHLNRYAFERDHYRAEWSFDRAKAIINSPRVHASWGPKATPNDGLELGLKSAREALLTMDEKIALYGPPVCPDSETPQIDVREFCNNVAAQENDDAND